jgi:TRAP-type C4-dicarboxylate transport system permease small subunit
MTDDDRARERRPWAALLARPLELASAVLALFMSVLTFADVTLRYLFNAPIFGSAEIVAFCLALSVFAGLALVAERNEHISVSLFEPLWLRRAPRAYAALRAAANVVGMLLFAWLLARQAGAVGAVGQISVVLQWPLFPLAAALTVFAAAGVLLALAAWRQGAAARHGSSE